MGKRIFSLLSVNTMKVVAHVLQQLVLLSGQFVLRIQSWFRYQILSSLCFFLHVFILHAILYWLTKATLQTFFADSSKRNAEV